MLLLHALQPVPAVIGWEVGYAPHRSPVCCRANTHRHTDNNSGSCAPTANLESPVYLTSLSLDSGIKPTHTQGGRENLWANKELFLSPWSDFHYRTVPDFQGLEIKPIAPGFFSVLSLYKNKIDHLFEKNSLLEVFSICSKHNITKFILMQYMSGSFAGIQSAAPYVPVCICCNKWERWETRLSINVTITTYLA